MVYIIYSVGFVHCSQRAKTFLSSDNDEFQDELEFQPTFIDGIWSERPDRNNEVIKASKMLQAR